MNNGKPKTHTVWLKLLKPGQTIEAHGGVLIENWTERNIKICVKTPIVSEFQKENNCELKKP